MFWLKYRTESIPFEPDTVSTVVGKSENNAKTVRFHSDILSFVLLFPIENIFCDRRYPMKVALTIAGSDSSGGAGIQADLKTFQAHGVYGMSAVTAVTVQNTQKVYDIQEIRPKLVYDQIVCLFDDIDIHAVKIGMVSSIELIQQIAKALKAVNPPVVVLDPVMISKSGYRLLNPGAQDALVQFLFPLSEVITPNIYEAETLIGSTIHHVDEMKTAAVELLRLGARKVVVKGGHLGEYHATDIVYDGQEFKTLQSPRIKTKNTHGTGCTFSSAIAANMALGKAFFEAVALAKNYITGAIEHSLNIGQGHGPTQHFFELYTTAGIDLH